MLYITAKEQPGLLVKIYRCLNQSDYKITSHHITSNPAKGIVLIKVVIAEGELPVSFNLESQLLNIEGCLDISYEEPQWDAEIEPVKNNNNEASESVKTKIKSTARVILNDINNVAFLVENFKRQCADGSVSNNLYSLGYEVGSAIYNAEYALGKPLKLELAIKRMLTDATKKFGKPSCGNKTLTIEENIFCSVRNPNGDCDFTKGYVTGFLRSSPTTKDVKVQQNSCRSHGQVSCSFEFQE